MRNGPSRAWALAGSALPGVTMGPTALARVPARPMLGTYLFVAWTTFVTVDPISIGGVPLKLFLLVLALGMWWPHRSRRPIPFAVPVVVVAVAAPILWSVVATLYPHPYTGMTPSPLRMTLEHASHFLYLLIYFPIADTLLKADSRRAIAMWLIPACLLVALTWALYVLHSHLGVDLGVTLTTTGKDAQAQLGPLLGVVTPPDVSPGRIFFANHILVVPTVAVLLGWLVKGSPPWWLPGVLLLVLGVLYPIHSRGLTIGVLAVLTVVAALSWRVRSPWPAALLGISLAVLFLTSFDARAAEFLTGERSDASSQDRVVQAPQLLQAFEQRPLLGSGLGATLPSGFFRAGADPYQFELSYHQILFQNGLVGLMVILGLPLLASIRALLAMRRLPDEEWALALAGVAGVAGLLVAGASNPYLISSYGMLALAVTLALCARATHVSKLVGPRTARG